LRDEKWVDAQNEFVKLLDKKDKTYTSFQPDETMVKELSEFLGDRILENLLKSDKSVHEATKEEVFKKFEGKYSKLQLSEGYDLLQKRAMRKYVNEEKKRVDGRGFDEIREMDAEVDLLPRVHGSDYLLEV
jgi:polyribonucleotide nucleotidyltransferase